MAVDLTPGTIGAVATSDVDFALEYRVPAERLGRIRFSVNGTRLLESTREIAPGVPFLDEGSGRFNPPDWRLRSNLSWSRDGWHSALRINFTGAIVATATGVEIPAVTNVDWNLGYRFRKPVHGSFGQGLHVAIGIGNVFDTPPPFADTIDGYRGGSPLGRTATLSFTLPL
jgi:hypothetical protein